MKSFLDAILLVTIQLALPIEAALVVVCMAGHQHPRRGAEAHSHGLAAQQTMVIPLLRYVF